MNEKLSTNTQPKKILVIEDDAILSSALVDNLTFEGFEVIIAKDGEEGVALALEKMPDLILLDILLPKKDGLSALTELRRDAWGKNVPVIVLSNLSEPSGIASAMGADVYEYLLKVDWKIEDVVKRVRAMLKM